MDAWLQSICSTPILLCTQSMYQFLCFDANMPPPYFEMQWRKSMNASFDEMDMVSSIHEHIRGAIEKFVLTFKSG